MTATHPAADGDVSRGGAPLVEIRDIVKDFPGNRALDHVSLDVRSGEIVAIVGHNGSGKSTLVKVLAGVYTSDGGTVQLAGDGDDRTELHIIHQDLGLVAELTTVENLGVPKHPGAHGWAPLNGRRERAHARTLVGRFGAPFDVTTPVGRLAPSQRSIVAIARALDGWRHPRNVLILDEPTEALHASEVAVLFDAVRSLAAEGAGIVFISHRLDEVLDLADRIVVLRDGQKVADEQRAGIDHDQLVAYVTGAAPTVVAARRRTGLAPGEPVLEIEGLSGGGVDDVSLTLHRGEVVGVAGVLGSGREALPSLIFGSADARTDRCVLAGRPYERRSPRASIRRGIGFVPGDRARFGSVRALTARENVTLPSLRGLLDRAGAVDVRRERAQVRDLIDAYDVRPPRTEQVFGLFSGGNQQKLVFAKWLRNRPSVVLLEEPTQGVDIGAKQALYGAIDAAADAGAAVLVCSSEAKELVRLCDRVLVMRGGRVAAELSGDRLTETQVVKEGYGLAGEEEP